MVADDSAGEGTVVGATEGDTAVVVMVMGVN
jgi:hypothetical protein